METCCFVLSRIDSTQFPSNDAIWNDGIKYLSPRFCTKVVIIYQCSTSEDSSRNQFSERHEASVNCTLHGINQFASPLKKKKKALNTYLLPFFVAVHTINSVRLRHTHANEDDSVKLACSLKMFFVTNKRTFKWTIIKVIVIRGYFNMTALYISRSSSM